MMMGLFVLNMSNGIFFAVVDFNLFSQISKMSKFYLSGKITTKKKKTLTAYLSITKRVEFTYISIDFVDDWQH
jgi:hypothetical protein